jgi:hypothetical protein
MRRRPYAQDGDVDCDANERNSDHNLLRESTVGNDNSNTVDDDLQQQRDLYAPAEY